MSNYISITDPPYNAVSGSGHDNTAALNAAFSQTGRAIFIPEGEYYHYQLDPPTCGAIIGESDFASVLHPMAGVTEALSIGGNHYPTRIASIQINGADTSGATGLGLGTVDHASTRIDTVRIVNFGEGGIGLRIADAIKSLLTKVTVERCSTNLLVKQGSSVFPTTIHFDSCVFTDAGGIGAKIQNGSGIIFTNCDFESSHLEGTLLEPQVDGERLDQIIFDSCWWEDNCRSDTSKYQFTAHSSGSAAVAVKTELRNPHFSLETGRSLAALFSGGGVLGFVVANPSFVSIFPSAISVQNGATGEFPQWEQTGGMNFPDIVDDPQNACSGGYFAQFRNWTPTFAALGAPTGIDPAGTQVHRAMFKRQGDQVAVNLDVSVQLVSSTICSAITASLPTGLTPIAATSLSSFCFSSLAEDPSGSATYRAAMAVAYSDGQIYLRRADNTSLPTNVELNFRACFTYQLKE